MDSLKRDIRHGARLLWRQPSFTLAAVSVLALGIGANTAIFSLVNAFLLKPLLLKDPAAVVGVFNQDAVKTDSFRGFSYAEYEALRGQSGVFADLLAHNVALVGVADDRVTDGTTRRAFAEIVSSNFFRTFGVPLYRGREFSSEEASPGSGAPVAILSYNLWQRLGGDAKGLGGTVVVNGRAFEVVGVAPEGFTGTTALVSSDVFLPLGVHDLVANDFGGRRSPLTDATNTSLLLVGRLAPGLTQESADAQLAAISKTLPSSGPASGSAGGERQAIVRPLSRMSISTQPTSDGPLRIPTILLLSMASIVLLVASLNVANMMLARGSARRKEISIRLALGAGRRSVLRQLVTESLLLSLLAGAAGLALAFVGTSLLMRSLSGMMPIQLVFDASPDLRVLAATFGFCVLATLLFGLGPALSLSRPDVFHDLKGRDQEAPSGGGHGWRRLLSRRHLLVIGQLSLSLMLLAAAGLFLRSSLETAQIRPGFRIERSLIAEIDPSLVGYDEIRGAALTRELVTRLKAVPGVESVAVAATVPFGPVSLGRSVQRASDAPPDPTAPAGTRDATVVPMSLNLVSADYFRTLGIGVFQGREFTDAESVREAPAVAILDQLAAEKLWPGGQALGQRIRLVSGDGDRPNQEAEVVGVVAPVKTGIFGSDDTPGIYLPLGQQAQSNVSLHVAAAQPGEAAENQLLDAMRREIRAVDPQLPLIGLKTVRGHLEGGFDFWLAQTGARMFLLFGAVALVMAVIGLYGVRAYSVARRTREIGIRMAIGASAEETLRMVLREGLQLTAIGLGLGLVLAAALGRLLSRLLYEVSGFEPLILGGAAAALAAVSLFACYLPARRAARIEPMVALRDE